jgi:predicted RNA-binding protein YlxR (DUF448 family)
VLAITPTNEELDRGPKSGAAVERLCAVTRVTQPVDAMIRFVRAPDGAVIPDVKRKLPGRGLWITATRQAVAEGVKRNVFARGFKDEVRPAGDLPALTERLLEQSALDALAMAGKARLALHGAAKVENALSRGQAVAILHAKDGAEDGKRKINAYLRRGAADLPVIEAFSVEQLDLALGRANVVHAALLAGPATTTFVARASRLARFCAPDEQNHHGAPRADA